MEIKFNWNIEGAIEKLRTTYLTRNELNSFFNYFYNFINGKRFNADLLNEVLLDNLNAKIE
jgi:hypothetical protein